MKCPHCKKSNGTLRNDTNRAFLLDFSGRLRFKEEFKSLNTLKTSKRQKNKKINNSNMDESEDEDIDEKNKKDIKFKMNISTDTLLDPLILSEKNLAQQLEQVEMGICEKLVWRAAEVRHHFRLLWKAEAHVLKLLFPFFEEVMILKSLNI